jgi:hypothetical protein
MFRRFIPIVLALLTAPIFCSAAPISVGTGPDTAEVVFNWPDGFIADYDVHFGTSPTSRIDGYDATQIALADPNLSLSWQNFPFGGIDPNYFLNIATYTGGHIGDGDTFDPVTAPDNFWAEWYSNNGSGWLFGNGASVDTLGNGDQIGWVFGSESQPIPEPATTAILIIVAALLLMRRFPRRAVVATAMTLSSSAFATNTVTVVPGSFTQGTVKSSLGGATSYAQSSNNLNDWPLTTGPGGAGVSAISFENPDFNGNSFGGNPNTIIAFGNGGGVTLQFATPITPEPGQKNLGIFTAQAISGGLGSLFNGNMDAAILVSSDNVNWFTLAGQSVTNPTTYTAITYPLNAPTMAYNFGTDAAAWTDGTGVPQSTLSALTIANFLTPMPDDSLFNNPSSTNAQRLALQTDTNPADYTETFGTSGGGNWFDLSNSSLTSIDYIRLNGDPNDPATGGVRLDAVFTTPGPTIQFIPEPSTLTLISLASAILFKRSR